MLLRHAQQYGSFKVFLPTKNPSFASSIFLADFGLVMPQHLNRDEVRILTWPFQLFMYLCALTPFLDASINLF